MPLQLRDVPLRQTRIPPDAELFRRVVDGTAAGVIVEYTVPDNRDLHIQRLLAHAHATGGETVIVSEVSIRKPNAPVTERCVIGLEELPVPQSLSVISITEGIHLPRGYILRFAVVYSAAIQLKSTEFNFYGWTYPSIDRML